MSSYNKYNKIILLLLLLTIILPVVLYGCETWTLALKEERRVRIFENKVPKRIFEPTGMKMESGEVFTKRNIIVRTVHLI